jgi:hypothetical protein
MASPRKKGIVVSPSGTPVSVFLLDETQIVLQLQPNTTAGAVCFSISRKIGLNYDAHYGLYCRNGLEKGVSFMPIEDSTVLAKILTKWQQEDTVLGPNRLYFKRAVWARSSMTDKAEDSETASTAQRLAYHDCVFHVLEGHYRFSVPDLVKLGALQLQVARGNHLPSRDTVELIRFEPLASFTGSHASPT